MGRPRLARAWSTAWTNKRTGETVQVPVGIDPGFAHNVGRLDPSTEAQALLDAKIANAAPDIAAAARGETLAALAALAGASEPLPLG